MDNSLEPWKAKGYQFDEGLNLPAGKIKNNNRSLCFYSEKEPTIGITIARWTLQAHLGRRIKDHEIVRFKTKDKLDLRKTNLVFHSRQATAKELFEMNGPPILGYSHCFCGCGETLDVQKQGDQPHAFVVGHSPADKRRTDTLEAAVGKIKDKKTRRRKKRPEKKIKEAEQPALTVPLPWDPEEALKPYRPLFERMICDLPWEKFRRVLQVLLQMERMEIQPCPQTEFAKK